MLMIFVASIAVLIAGVLLYAATRPDTFRVRRSASIKAPAEKLFPLINDLHRFNSWNPYEKKDPNIEGRYSGADSGKGAVYEFDGNKEVGKGSLAIVDSTAPTRVAMQLRMTAPMAADNVIEFALEPKGDITRVTWAMQGRCPYLGKLIGLFVDMERMVGRDFEAGLANLKAAAEG